MKTYIVDSFTNESFKGNPAGVCFPENELSEEIMLKIAQELNLSETAFVKPGDKKNTYRIRYFSPKKEIALCGHATLASAKVLFENTAENEIEFITSEGLHLFVSQDEDGEEITMEFPVYETSATTVTAEVLNALGIPAVTNSVFNSNHSIILLEISGAQLLADLTPDFNALVNSCSGIDGILVTAPSDDQRFDYHYRYFWPWSGSNEDPVTGGVQTFLAKYWGVKLNKKRLNAFQSSSRTGNMTVELIGNKVLLISKAVIVLEGNLVVFDNLKTLNPENG